jgi:hypothetical protein
MRDEPFCGWDLWEYMWDHDDEPLHERERQRAREKARRRSARRWPEDRLARLLGNLRDRWWPGRLDGWRVVIVPEGGCGHPKFAADCVYRERLIRLTPDCGRSRRALASTLLHEICHAAVGGRPCGPTGHGIRFFQEVERLLASDAPIRIDHRHYLTEPDAALVDALPLCGLSRKAQAWRRRVSQERAQVPRAFLRRSQTIFSSR